MKTYAIEISALETADYYRSWECGFCHTRFRMVLNDPKKPDAVPGWCCNCGWRFIEWKEHANSGTALNGA